MKFVFCRDLMTRPASQKNQGFLLSTKQEAIIFGNWCEIILGKNVMLSQDGEKEWRHRDQMQICAPIWIKVNKWHQIEVKNTRSVLILSVSISSQKKMLFVNKCFLHFLYSKWALVYFETLLLYIAFRNSVLVSQVRMYCILFVKTALFKQSNADNIPVLKRGRVINDW